MRNQLKIKCTTSWFFLPMYIKYCSGIRSQDGQGGHWRMWRKETEFESISTYARSRWGEEGGMSVPLFSIAMYPPTGHHWKQGTIKITRICWIVSETQWRGYADTTLCSNLEILNCGSQWSRMWVPMHCINYTMEIRNNIEMEEIVAILWLLTTQTVVSGPAASASPGR